MRFTCPHCNHRFSGMAAYHEGFFFDYDGEPQFRNMIGATCPSCQREFDIAVPRRYLFCVPGGGAAGILASQFLAQNVLPSVGVGLVFAYLFALLMDHSARLGRAIALIPILVCLLLYTGVFAGWWTREVLR